MRAVYGRYGPIITFHHGAFRTSRLLPASLLIPLPHDDITTRRRVAASPKLQSTYYEKNKNKTQFTIIYIRHNTAAKTYVSGAFHCHLENRFFKFTVDYDIENTSSSRNFKSECPRNLNNHELAIKCLSTLIESLVSHC